MKNNVIELKLLTVSEVADLMSVSPQTIYRHVHSGFLPAVKIGRTFRILESSIYPKIPRKKRQA